MLSIHHKTFKEIIKGSSSYSEKKEISIPTIQRDYVWKKDKQVNEFWEDVLEVFENGDYKNLTPEQINDIEIEFSGLYLGNLIVVDKQNNNFEIIDGQQRITTIFLFIVAFIRWLREYKNNLIENGEDQHNNVIRQINLVISELEKYLFQSQNTNARIRLTLKRKMRLIFNEMCDPQWDETFKNSIIDGTSPVNVQKENNIIRPVYKFFKEKLTETLIEETVKYQYFFIVINNLQFSEVNVHSEKEAHLYFERTNSRGKPLETAELLKAYILGNCRENDSVDIDRWNKLSDDNNVPRTGKMLISFYQSISGLSTSQNYFSSIKKVFAPSKFENRQKTTLRLLKDLENYSDFYKIFKPEKQLSKKNIKQYLEENSSSELSTDDQGRRLSKILRSIDAIDYFGIESHLPVTYSILKKFFNIDTNKHPKIFDKLVDLFQNFESMYFLTKVTNVGSPKNYVTTLNNFSLDFHNLEQGNIKYEEAKSLIHAIEALEYEAKKKNQETFKFNGEYLAVKMTDDNFRTLNYSPEEIRQAKQNIFTYKNNNYPYQLSRNSATQIIAKVKQADLISKYFVYLCNLKKVSQKSSFNLYKEDCNVCNSSGEIDGSQCESCEGKGFISEQYNNKNIFNYLDQPIDKNNAKQFVNDSKFSCIDERSFMFGNDTYTMEFGIEKAKEISKEYTGSLESKFVSKLIEVNNFLKSNFRNFDDIYTSFKKISYEKTETQEATERALLRYIFDRICNYKESGPQPSQSSWLEIFNREHESDFEIEHFYPKNPGKGYEDMPWKHRLGNLFALGHMYNRDVNNSQPEKKIEILKQNNGISQLQRDPYFAEKDTSQFVWTEEDIYKREEVLARTASEKVWKWKQISDK